MTSSGSSGFETPVGRRIYVRGTVQGVGFRPWVYRLATETRVRGRIRNDARGVTIDAFGSPRQVAAFTERLRIEAPLPARVRELQLVDIPAEPVEAFVITPSDATGDAVLSIPPDLATCPACLAEVFDEADRRYRYPFTNCTSCGPRFTIATGVPYDRPLTTMAPFRMCPACQAEYSTVENRRFHAQPNACPVCGPRLTLLAANGAPLDTSDPLAAVAFMLGQGDIVAIKGLGGFHLACDATSPDAVAGLRRRKRRDEKPFAVMVGDLARAEQLAVLDDEARALLVSPERPIVLVRRKPECEAVVEVAPDTDLIGIMLPYTPLHHLLMQAVDRPLVMTSGNVSSEPICCDNDEAVRRLHGIAKAFLVHDRAIAGRCDDSVGAVIAGTPTIIRRSRGYVPRPIQLRRPVAAPILALGAHLKNTFCLVRDDLAYLGPHVGDLECVETVDFLGESIERMCDLLELTPRIIAHDLHPDYESTRMALGRPESIKIAVQHHHAHIASLMAEHHLVGPVIGIAFDGTGYGTDGTAWGGEILLVDYTRYERLATFRPIALPGGDVAIREVWRIALALLADAFPDGDDPRGELSVFGLLPPERMEAISKMIAAGVGCPRARGVGRYFDGVGALGLGLQRSSYEGQVAVAWNRVADPHERGRYPFDLDRRKSPIEIDLRPTIRTIATDLIAGANPARVSGRFHNTIVAATVEAIGNPRGLPVALSGGVFQNELLVAGLEQRLGSDALVVHRDVPPNDGGIALGQAVVASAVAELSATTE